MLSTRKTRVSERQNSGIFLFFFRRPNNAGVFTSFDMESFEEPTDAFKSDWNVEVRLQRNDESGAKFRESRLVFKASNSSPIYSDSVSTVQPSSLRALVLVRAY